MTVKENFIIAINKDDESRWLMLKGKFPLEEECLDNYFLFDIYAYSLSQAVSLAKIKRVIRLNNSNYEPEDETYE